MLEDALGPSSTCSGCPTVCAWIRGRIVPGSGWLHTGEGVQPAPVNSLLQVPQHVLGQEALPALGTFLSLCLSPGLVLTGAG